MALIPTEHWRELLHSGEHSDLTIRWQQDDLHEDFKVHAIIVESYSPDFTCSKEQQAAANPTVRLVSNVHPVSLDLVIKYMYVGSYDVTDTMSELYSLCDDTSEEAGEESPTANANHHNIGGGDVLMRNPRSLVALKLPFNPEASITRGHSLPTQKAFHIELNLHWVVYLAARTLTMKGLESMAADNFVKCSLSSTEGQRFVDLVRTIGGISSEHAQSITVPFFQAALTALRDIRIRNPAAKAELKRLQTVDWAITCRQILSLDTTKPEQAADNDAGRIFKDGWTGGRDAEPLMNVVGTCSTISNITTCVKQIQLCDRCHSDLRSVIGCCKVHEELSFCLETTSTLCSVTNARPRGGFLHRRTSCHLLDDGGITDKGLLSGRQSAAIRMEVLMGWNE